MTPTPAATPTPVSGEDVATVLAVEGLAVVVAALLLGFGAVWVTLLLARRRPVAMVPGLVAMLTLAALIAFAFTREEGLETITATGVGALAAALNSLFSQHRPPDDDREEEEP